nr:MAG TPA: hypothetical protein [Caudoviricetes sp.]
MASTAYVDIALRFLLIWRTLFPSVCFGKAH